MQKLKQEVLFSSSVTDSTDMNEFVIEFFSDKSNQGSPIKVTRNFDELIEFFTEMEE